MKKIISFLLSICLIATVTTAAYATEITYDISGEENPEIYISAEELKKAEIKIAGENLITLTTVNESTSQQKLSKSNDGRIKTRDVKTTALLVKDLNETEKLYNTLVAKGDEGSSYLTDSNYVVGLTIHSRVNYEVITDSGEDYYRFISVEGGNNKKNASNIIGNGFMISKQTVNYGVFGLNLEGKLPGTYSDAETLSNSAGSFNIDVDGLHPEWPTVLDRQSALGATYTVTVHSTRDGSDTVLEVVNNPLDGVDLWPF